MNPSVFLLLSCLSCGFLVAGCATAPTPTQQLFIDSGIRSATTYYILQDDIEAKQQARAARVLATTQQVRKQITLQGSVVPDLDVLAKWTIKQIAGLDLSATEKRLLQAAMLEAIFLAQDTGVAAADIGTVNAVVVLNGLAQADRVARTLMGS